MSQRKTPEAGLPASAGGGPDDHGPFDAEALDRQRVLGARLKTLFDGVVKEPVPDEFIDLLSRLDEQGRR